MAQTNSCRYESQVWDAFVELQFGKLQKVSKRLVQHLGAMDITYSRHVPQSLPHFRKLLQIQG